MNDNILDDIDFENEERLEMEFLLESFIQRRSDIYISYWENPTIITFDFLKMMLGVPWLLYRKMYLITFLVLFVIMLMFNGSIFSTIPILAIIVFVKDFNFMIAYDASLLYLFPTLIVMGICGIANKYIYIEYVVKKIEYLKNKIKNEEILVRTLEIKGGYEIIFPIIFTFFIFFVFFNFISTGKFNPILTF